MISKVVLIVCACAALTLPVGAQQADAPAGVDTGQAQAAAGDPQQAATQPPVQNTEVLHPQPKRILGVMPNFRAVSAGTLPPPPTRKEAFKIATQNSFDYSAFVFTGFTSALAEWSDAHPQLGEGMKGYGRYYWRGFVDKTDGNYLVIYALPMLFRQDERYYALGKGSIWKRFSYSMTRVVITPDYHGHDSLNASELLGRGIAQGISLSYYPSKARTGSALAERYAYAVLRDALTNAFREFWPDIAVHVLHRHP